MSNWSGIFQSFLAQARKGDLKTASYPKDWEDFRLRVSFGMGAPARIPWIAFIAPEMQVSNGFYPVYLYYKEFETLILAYGVSETEEFGQGWPAEIMNSTVTVAAHFDKDVRRYGDSFVFKAYKVSIQGDQIKCSYSDTGALATEKDIEADLATILGYYKKVIFSAPSSAGPIESSANVRSQGLFYMEKQLEDFIIHNWAHTELGKRFDLIIEEGELVSQQYRTEIGPIDILAKDKTTNSYVVIELKKNQTSDDTIGQLARYMGWISESKKDSGVKGIIIAGEYDRKLDYALKVMPNVEVFLYQVDFRLNKFIK